MLPRSKNAKKRASPSSLFEEALPGSVLQYLGCTTEQQAETLFNRTQWSQDAWTQLQKQLMSRLTSHAAIRNIDLDELQWLPTARDQTETPLHHLIQSIFAIPHDRFFVISETDRRCSVNIDRPFMADLFRQHFSFQLPSREGWYKEMTAAESKQIVSASKLVAVLLAFYMMAVIKSHQLTFPFKMIDKQDALSAFAKLKQFANVDLPARLRKSSPHQLEEITQEEIAAEMRTTHGTYHRLVDYFTQEERLKCARYSSESGSYSPVEVWENNDNLEKLKSAIYTALFRFFTKAIKPAFVTEKIVAQLVDYYGVSGYRLPVPIIISRYLEAKYNTTIQCVVDPCGGWANREIAFLAMDGVHTIHVNDTNSALANIYSAIPGELNCSPKYKHVIATNSPCEKLNIPRPVNDLLFSSPPFFNTEVYHGASSSHALYPSYEAWKINFLFKFNDRAGIYIRDGGFIALTFKNVQQGRKNFPIVDDFVSYAGSRTELTPLPFFDYGARSHSTIRSGKEQIMLFRVKHITPVIREMTIPDENKKQNSLK